LLIVLEVAVHHWVGPVALGPVMRQYIMEGIYGRGNHSPERKSGKREPESHYPCDLKTSH
jgi:hypothetical protein